MVLLRQLPVLVLLLAENAQGGCTVTSVMGCYHENSNTDRILGPKSLTAPMMPMTHEICAQICTNNKNKLAGVEYGRQCYCGDKLNYPGVASSGCSFPCRGNASQHCGGDSAIEVFSFKCVGAPVPIPKRPPPPPPPPPATQYVYHGCMDATSKAEKYCNATLSYEDRVDAILSKLSLADKIALASPTKAPYCACHTTPIASAHLPDYKWLTETNSCVNAPCVDQYRCPTTFVGPTNMAASFNRSSWYAKGDVISTEMRALNNQLWVAQAPAASSSWHSSDFTPEPGDTGLTGFGPNINVVKDPRYGRNSELPGEDPVLTAAYAVAYTQGMQQIKAGKSGKKYLKMLSYMKHYTAYSVEESRFTFSANVTNFTLHDSNLPQYRAAHVDGLASGVMCSYFAPNGISSCGNPYLLNELIRKEWGRPDAVVMSDCSAVGNMRKNVMKLNDTQASAQAMNAGMDIYGGWGDNLWVRPTLCVQGQGDLATAVTEGLTDEATITASTRRTLMQKMKVGLFDAPEDSPWAKLGADALNSTHAQQVAYEAALQGMVLLKNDKKALPLKTGGIKLAVVGPFGDSASMLKSDYEGAGDDSNETIFGALRRANIGGSTVFASGCAVKGRKPDPTTITAAEDAVKAADATVVVLGLEKKDEHEGMDRKDTLLPSIQESFAASVFKAAGSNPVVVVLCNGGAVSIDDLIGPASAIIEAFNPAQQGPAALAALMFGKENRWGKLPITIYDKDYASQLEIQNMEYDSVSAPPGRSYRYYTGTPLFSFGEGLSLTTFSHSCTCEEPLSMHTHLIANDVSCTCTLHNTGKMAGDEVIMVFDSLSSDIRATIGKAHPVPIKRLVAFDRSTVTTGESVTVRFSIPQASLAITTANGSKKLYPGVHNLVFSRGNKEADVTVPFTIAAEIA